MRFKEFIKGKHRFVVYLILGLFVIMEVAGHVLFSYRKKQTETQTYYDLSTINAIKIERIEEWFHERKSDGEVIQGDAFLLDAIKHWLFNSIREDSVLRKKLLDYFGTLKSSDGYSSISLFDPQLNLLLSTPAGGNLSEYASTLALETIWTKQIMLSDLHIGRQHDVHIDLLVPLLDAATHGGAVMAILVIKLDPAYFLYPLIASWPFMSPSSESVLVRREGDSVIFLNKPRLFSGQPAGLKIPLGATSVPAVRAVTGYEGHFTGTDYLGHRVLSDIRSIPGTNWYIISKVNRGEVLYPVYERFIASNAFTVLVILIVSFALYGSWSRQQVRQASERQALLQRFEYMIKYANDIFILTDRDNKIIDVNEAALREYGYARDEFLTMSIDRIQSPDHIKDMEREMTALAGNIPARIETWHMRKDGTLFPVEIGLQPVSIDGRFYIQRIIREITDRVQAEMRIRELNEQLEARVNERTAQLAALNRELEAFSYSVSHDLRAPLRCVDGFSQALEEDYRARLDEKGLDYLARIRKAAQRMGELIDDLLSLALITKKDLILEKVNLSKMVQSLLSDLFKSHPDRKVSWKIQDNIEVKADKNLIKIVLENLLDNACKFTSTRDRTFIEFFSTEADGRITCYVRDNGVGFNPQYANKLFIPFQRLHDQHVFPGTGIGLATVQRIIRRHGGQVGAETTEGAGSTFYFTLSS